MCIGGRQAAPAPPPRTPEAAQAPEVPTQRVGGAGKTADERRRRAAAGDSGRSTILTSPRGVQDGAATAQKTLLGQ